MRQLGLSFNVALNPDSEVLLMAAVANRRCSSIAFASRVFGNESLALSRRAKLASLSV